MAELQPESGFLGIHGAAFCFSLLRRPFYGGFAYFAFPRWALGVNGRPSESPPGPPRNPAERYGSVKGRNCERDREF